MMTRDEYNRLIDAKTQASANAANLSARLLVDAEELAYERDLMHGVGEATPCGLVGKEA